MMGRKANYQDIGGPTGHLARLEPFEGNSMSGFWLTNDRYVVQSYHTPIAHYDVSTGGVWVSEQHYSQTTSRQQNLCRAWLGSESYMNDDARALGLI